MTALPGAGRPRPREAGRVVLLDPDWSVLLIHERIEAGTHWLTPGGGRESGESLARAAARETYEETSLRVDLDDDEPIVHVAVREWHWRGTTYRQTDHYFVVRLDQRPPVAPAAPTEMERETLLGFRWWSADQLRAAPDDIEPADLADLIERLRSRDEPRG